MQFSNYAPLPSVGDCWCFSRDPARTSILMKIWRTAEVFPPYFRAWVQTRAHRVFGIVPIAIAAAR